MLSCSSDSLQPSLLGVPPIHKMSAFGLMPVTSSSIDTTLYFSQILKGLLMTLSGGIFLPLTTFAQVLWAWISVGLVSVWFNIFSMLSFG
ncbi:hypothetical protein AYI68_g4239 [Smittium mucronatum]|uniref:Uncharacterized protein n=1 Tax=Smittium mucronatum TaxID=133383 RepID=A0A1R0GXS9_9FUNG|nr:hypothetical protein AYI68_g4239 [Smittium mucronatum]